MTKFKRPPRGTTELPGGGKMIYDGDLTVLDKDGEVVSWIDASMVGMLFDEEVDCGEVVARPTWVWVEAGVAMERYLRKHGGHALPNAFAPVALGLPQNAIELLDDGFHYRRVFGSGSDEEVVTKVVFGFRDEALAQKAFEESDGDIRGENFYLKSMVPDDEHPDELRCAVAFENQLFDLCWEEGFRDLTPGLARDLEKTIEILERSKERESRVGGPLVEALDLRNVMPELKIVRASWLGCQDKKGEGQNDE